MIFPSIPLFELLALLDVTHDGSLKSIAEATQKKWAQIGKERWECDRREEDKKEAIFPLLKLLGQLDKISAKKTSYDYCLVLGGLTQRMERRLATLACTWKRGVRFEKLIFLTGERMLERELEKSFTAFLKTETEVLLHLFSRMEIPVPLEVIDTPRKGKIRPNTEDTIRAWLATSPISGSCLAISDQPFVCYHHAVLKSYLPSSFALETIGKESDDELWVAVYLDNLARTLYQIAQ